MNHSASLALVAFVAALPLVTSLHAQTFIPTGTSRYDVNAPGSYVLTDGATRSITSGGNEVIRIANSGTAGTYSLTVNGSIIQSGSGRGIRTGNSGAGVNVDITIGETGFVRGTSDDAIQGRSTGTFNLTNLGTLYSGSDLSADPTVMTTGRGLNLRDAIGGGIILNGSATNSTALIRADGGDAVRVGSGFSFINYGVILGNGRVNDNSANNVFSGGSIATPFQASDGFSFEDQDLPGPGATNSSLDNYGRISGARHGVEAGERGSSLTVANQVSGEIIGRNGSGIGFDTLETDPSKIVINNHGLIRGDYAGAGNIIDRTGGLSATNDGDGDGIDIDGAATIHNHVTGRILSTGAGGYDTLGRANNSEAISIGGGVIVNDGLIQGADRGIIVNNDAVASRSGFVAATVINNAGGTIEGLNGFAIRLENKFGDARDNDTITNAGTLIGGGEIPLSDRIVTIQGGAVDGHSVGTLDGVVYTGTGESRFIRGDGSAIQMGEGDDVLTNTGTIIGSNGLAINMEGGNDTVNYNAGTITGAIDGGTGTDTLNLGAGVVASSAIKNFEQINVATAIATISGVVGGTTLNKGGAGALVLSNSNTYTGLTTVEAGALRVSNLTGSATGVGDVIVNAGARLEGNGIIDGNVRFDGVLAAGNGNDIGALTVNGDVTWNGDAANAWQFELGAGDSSDRLLVGGDFLRGTGTDFVFDFQSGASTGTFVLIDWAGTTDFTAADFSYTHLAQGLTGVFALDGGQLEFTASVSAVPEPATYAALAGLGVLGLALSRRRRMAA